MPLANTILHYGAVTKLFHWLTALLILAAIPLGVIANLLPYDTGEQLAAKAQLFSLHKTVGIAAFAVALLRILWAMSQPRPAPLHAERRLETLLAATVHWALYGAMVVVPLSGWLHHAATAGFAPILWPLGQGLPFLTASKPLAALFAAVHWVFTKVLIAAVLLHVAGALKHALIDKDATLARMLPGTPDVNGSAVAKAHMWPAAFATGLFAAGLALSVALAPATQPVVPASAITSGAGNWQVEQGSLAITLRQFGTEVTGQFAQWVPEIVFSETGTDGRHGTVTVDIVIASLTLGSVTEQALSADYFDAAQFPAARFNADILTADSGYVADGTLTLKGAQVPVILPFTLIVDGDTARMRGKTTLDRRDFAIGAGQADEGTLGFAVVVEITLTATRSPR